MTDNTSSFLASLGVDDSTPSTPTFNAPNQVIVLDNDTGKNIDEVDVQVVESEKASVDDDFAIARDNIVDVVSVAKDAIEKLAVIADQSQHPRAFEVLGSLIKTVLDAQQDMLALHKKREELKPGSVKDTPKEGAPHSITNQNLFVGSTAELQRILEDMAKPKQV